MQPNKETYIKIKKRFLVAVSNKKMFEHGIFSLLEAEF